MQCLQGKARLREKSTQNSSFNPTKRNNWTDPVLSLSLVPSFSRSLFDPENSASLPATPCLPLRLMEMTRPIHIQHHTTHSPYTNMYCSLQTLIHTHSLPLTHFYVLLLQLYSCSLFLVLILLSSACEIQEASGSKGAATSHPNEIRAH